MTLDRVLASLLFIGTLCLAYNVPDLQGTDLLTHVLVYFIAGGLVGISIYNVIAAFSQDRV